MHPELSGFYDCSASMGRGATPPINSISTAAALIAEMDRFGIEKALVHHVLSRDLSPSTGNLLLMEAIQAFPRLLPVWGVLPEFFDSPARAAEFEQRLAASGVRAVRLFPFHHNLRLGACALSPLLERLAAIGTVLFVARDEIDWNGLATLLGVAALQVVLVNPGYRNDRHLFPLLERYPNLHIEASTYVGHRMVEEFVGRFGSARLVLGTQIPAFDPGAILAVLAYADLRQADRMNICRENLRRLLGEAA
jgi:predicted TIM-barrel fold metal-dependent hydrolase